MEIEPLVFAEGKTDCEHYFVAEEKELYGDENGIKSNRICKQPIGSDWCYLSRVSHCKTCGREVLLGGTILIPAGSGFMRGEYTLEPDGSIGFWIGE